MMTATAPDLMNETDAAAFLGLKPNTLGVWRCTRRYALPYLRVGSRLIRYRRSDLIAFLERGAVEPVAAQ